MEVAARCSGSLGWKSSRGNISNFPNRWLSSRGIQTVMRLAAAASSYRSVEVQMKARDIMTPDPSVVTPQQPIAHAAEIMRERDVGMVPVVDDVSNMRLEGVLTDRDIAVRCVAFGHDGSCKVQDHMTTDDLDVVRADADISEVVTRMETDRVRRIPVVADGARVVGIIAQADLALKLGPKDPTLVEEVLERISEPVHT
jgi:CBS domain-containing protein